MSQPKLISPLLDNFMIGEPICDHNGIRCCPAMNSETSEKYIVKIISLPPSQTQLDALLLTGVLKDEEDAKQYYTQRAQDWVSEIQTLQQLSKQEGFLACENYQIVPSEDGVGYEIYILTPYKRTLARQLGKKPFTQLDALNLGLDICSALAACRRNGFLFTNLKPSNIFLTENGEFKIGDLGFLNLNALHYSAVAEHCFSEYTAPEITDAYSSVNDTLDVYALGMVLYGIFNGGVLPEDRTKPLPAPQYADEEMAQILLKACDPDPAARWSDPAQMGQMLVSYMQKNGAFDVPIVPPAPEPEPEVPEIQDEAEPSEESAEDIVADLPEEQSIEEEAAVSESEAAPEAPAAEELEMPAQEEGAAPSEEQPTILDFDEQQEIPVAEILAEFSTSDADETDPQQILEILENHDAFAEETAEIKAAAIYLDIDNSPEAAEDISYDDISEEVSQILSQADALADMEVPDPVVAPEAIEISVPQPEEEVEVAEEEPADETDITEEEDYMYDNNTQAAEQTGKRPHWVRHSILIAILLLLIAGGFLFFKYYVLETVNSLELTGTNDSLIVKIETEADEALLSVTCEDKFGTTLTAPVHEGIAEFTGLRPELTYDVRVNISGLHMLTGETSDTHTTPEETVLLQYNVITGNAIGTAVLNFTFDGPVCDNWTLSYATDGYEAQTITLTGTSLTITDLLPDKIYNGILTPEVDLFITEPIAVSFSATELVQANNLKITGCYDGTLSVTWDAPESVNVENWTVRCYSNTDGSTYDQTFTTGATSYEFRDLNSAESFTVEVTAVGQTIVQKATIGENSVTVSNLALAEYSNGNATLTWDCEVTPENGWIVSYTVDDAQSVITVPVSETTAVIPGMIPNAKYSFTVQSADDVHTFCNTVTCQTADTEDFSIVINNKKIVADNFEFSLFRHPDKEGWTRYDVNDSHFTNTLTLDEEAGFIGFLAKKYEESNVDFTTTIVVRNEQGEILGISSQTGTWKSVWSNNYTVFLFPTLPDEAGVYTVSVYLNGQFAQEQTFSIA